MADLTSCIQVLRREMSLFQQNVQSYILMFDPNSISFMGSEALKNIIN